MTMRFRNSEDNRRYVAAEDAFTSEGGYLAQEDEVLGKHADAGRENAQMSRAFRNTVDRYATEMRHVLTVIRGGSIPQATRTASPPAR